MSELVEQVDTYAASLAAPVSADNPSGRDASFEPSFEVLKAEIDKLSSVSGGIVDWKAVGIGAAELTKTLSKDVRVLVWLVVARLKVDGPRGLAAALSACKKVCEAHWESLFPPVKRARARGNQFEWLFEQLDKEIPELKLGNGDKEALELSSELAKELDAFVSEKLSDHYSAIPRTPALLRQRAGELTAPTPTPAAPPSAMGAGARSAPAAVASQAPPLPASASVTAVAVAAPEPVTITGAQGATTALRTAATTIKAAALELRRDSDARPLGYSLSRIATWLLVERLPPATDGSRTALPPPRDKARLETLAANEKWTELLAAAEELASTSVFWLDPHRFSALALERLGASHGEARKALEREVVHFVARVPGIVSLQFADGTPFADAACVAWLDAIRPAQGGSAGAGKHEQLSEEDEESKARFETAKELVASGKVDEGLELAHALSCRAPDARARFRARLEVALLATLGGKRAVACALLDAMVRETEQHLLEEWEPELAARVYAALLTARGGAGASGSTTPSDEEIFARLSRLSPARALRISGR